MTAEHTPPTAAEVVLEALGDGYQHGVLNAGSLSFAEAIVDALERAGLLRPDTPPPTRYERFGSVLRSDAPMLRETPSYERYTATNVDAPDENWEPVYRLVAGSDDSTEDCDSMIVQLTKWDGEAPSLDQLDDGEWMVVRAKGLPETFVAPRLDDALRAALVSQPKGTPDGR